MLHSFYFNSTLSVVRVSIELCRVQHVRGVVGRVEAENGEGPQVQQQQVRQEGRAGHGRVAEKHHCPKQDKETGRKKRIRSKCIHKRSRRYANKISLERYLHGTPHGEVIKVMKQHASKNGHRAQVNEDCGWWLHLDRVVGTHRLTNIRKPTPRQSRENAISAEACIILRLLSSLCLRVSVHASISLYLDTRLI